jgi:hypothetical protein
MKIVRLGVCMFTLFALAAVSNGKSLANATTSKQSATAAKPSEKKK